MRYADLSKIKKIYFTPKDVEKALLISYASALVTCSRYEKKGLLIRIKRNYYALPHVWERIREEEGFLAANILEVPSYISLTTALGFYNVTTQVQRDFYESVSVKRTKEILIKDKTFVFSKIDRKLYQGFQKVDGYFIAEPEKALLDVLYFMSLKKYEFDFTACDFKKINKTKAKTYIKLYPEKVKTLWRRNVGPV